MSTYLKPGLAADYEDAPKWMLDYLRFLQTILGRSPKTCMTYYHNLRTFFQWVSFYLMHGKNPTQQELNLVTIRQIPLDTVQMIRTDDVYEFLFFCDTVLNNSAATRNQKLTSIDGLYQYLQRKKVCEITENPAATIDRAKTPQKRPVFLTQQEQEQLLSSIKGENQIRDYAIILLALVTGLRVSEIAALDTSDISYENGLLTVRGGKGGKDRVDYLTPPLMDAMQRYEEQYRNRVEVPLIEPNAYFVTKRRGTRLTTKAIENLVKKHTKEAGIWKDITPHKLRHTAATSMAKDGVPVLVLQQLMGHNSPNTTQIYTHLDSDDIRNALADTQLNALGEQ